MNMQQVSGITALVAAAGGFAGAGVAQPVVIDWLLPATGLWSDPANWSDGNVPDSFDEAANLAPDPIGGVLSGVSALVDGAFEVEELTGNGVVSVAVQGDATLSVGSIIRGTGVEPLTIFVGDDASLAAPARLEMLGTIRGDVSRVEGNTIVLLNGESAEFDSVGSTRFEDTTELRGNGIVRGGIRHSGRIVAEAGLSDTLLFENADLSAAEAIALEDAVLRISQSEAAGLFLSDRGSVVFDQAEVRSATIDRPGFNGSAIVESASTFTDVLIAQRGELIVRDRLRYDATDGIFFNEGRVIVEGFGRIEFDDTPGQTLLFDDGEVRLVAVNGQSPQFRLQDDDEMIVLPFARLLGEGTVFGDVFNLGSCFLRIFRPEDPASELQIIGDFEQDRIGALAVGVVQAVGPSAPGPVGVQRLAVSGNVRLGGDLNVTYFAVERNAIAGVPFVVLEHRDPQGVFTFEGEFDSVFLGTLPVGLSRIPLIEYADNVGVTFTVFCLADVNRNSVVDGQDFSAWILAYNERDPLADQNADGQISPADFNAWIDNFNGGCGH